MKKKIKKNISNYAIDYECIEKYKNKYEIGDMDSGEITFHGCYIPGIINENTKVKFFIDDKSFIIGDAYDVEYHNDKTIFKVKNMKKGKV